MSILVKLVDLNSVHNSSNVDDRVLRCYVDLLDLNAMVKSVVTKVAMELSTLLNLYSTN